VLDHRLHLGQFGVGGREQRGAHQAIAPELRSAVGNARRTRETVEHSLASDAPLQQGVQDTLHEVSRATASLRALTDYLKRHPEALIRGKKEDLP
jgi:paraquat-inducible protein B